MCMSMKNTMDLDKAKMKFLLAIVVYNPNDEIFNKINSYSNYGLFNKVYVYDNSATSYKSQFSQEIIYDSNGSNDGLAVAYNKCIRYGLDNDYDFVCFLDQDSFFEKSQVEKMESYIVNNISSMQDVAMVGPWWDKNNPEDNKEELVDQKYMINSGTFLNLKIVQEQNVFYDENLGRNVVLEDGGARSLISELEDIREENEEKANLEEDNTLESKRVNDKA